MPIALSVDTGTIGRYSAEVEAAVYFACLYALKDIAMTRDAGPASIGVREAGRSLEFHVRSESAELRGGRPSSLLQAMSDQIGGIGGEVRIESILGGKRVVTGVIPL